MLTNRPLLQIRTLSEGLTFLGNSGVPFRRALLRTLLKAFSPIFFFPVALLAQTEAPAADFAGFTIKECAFRFVVEDSVLVLEYENKAKQPEVRYARLVDGKRFLQLGMNCPARIAAREFRTGYSKFPQVRLRSDGQVIELSFVVGSGVSVRPEVSTSPDYPQTLRILFKEASEPQLPMAPSATSSSSAIGAEAATSSSSSVLPPSTESPQAVSEVSTPSGDQSSTAAEVSSSSSMVEQPPQLSSTSAVASSSSFGVLVDSETSSSSFAQSNEIDDVLLPKPDMLDKLSAEQINKGRQPSPAKENPAVSTTSSSAKRSGIEHSPLLPKRAPKIDFRPITDTVEEDFHNKAAVLTVFSFVTCVCATIVLFWFRRNSARGSKARGPNTAGTAATDDLSSCYELLGVRATDSNEIIKKRYKHLVKVFHADKLKSQDLPEEMMALANERYQQIQDAYEKIKSKRGMS